jgi:hypothetical protein
MRSITVSPSATSPAITRLAEARRSVAITVAPVSSSTPWTIAVLPSMSMRAPSRRSSCTCMKRFSKMVSVTCAVPSATQLSAMNCACMSVGKPGCGAVRSAPSAARAHRDADGALAVSTVRAGSRSLPITASRLPPAPR